MTNKKCIKCGKEKHLIVRNAYYHGTMREDETDTSLNVSLDVIICELCYDRLARPREEQIQILAREIKAGQVLLQIGLKEGMRNRKTRG